MAYPVAYATTTSKSTQPPTDPPFSRQARHHPRRNAPDLRIDSRHDDGSRPALQPAEPEVISSLITSLSVISKPPSSLDRRSSSSVPTSPGQGSFGVEYGTYSQPSLRQLVEESVDLDELAAAPPTIRTAKPPSGRSPVTAPKSPKSPKREPSSAGLRSFLRSSRTSSRPSSRGSATSNDDTRSLGNLSIERPPELNHQRSHDSWGRKSGKNQKGLMYMTSKERLRISEDGRRTSGGASAHHYDSSSSSRLDPFLTDAIIFEEPSRQLMPERSSSLSPNSVPSSKHWPIPDRESSLHKTKPDAKRTSYRVSRQRRNSDDGFYDISENAEQSRARDTPDTWRVPPVRHYSEAETVARRGHDASRRGLASPPKTRLREYNRIDPTLDDDDLDDGAPFPAVYSSRRRSVQDDRRGSGRLTPDVDYNGKSKRSSSKTKRNSGAKSTGPESRAVSPQPTVGYERPQSADSVDDAVEAYLRSPRLTQKIRHPQTGRVISFSEVGDPEGSAVFCCVGMGLTRYIMAFYDELALTLKLRLITPDRPGVGDSEAYTDGTATPLSWPDDVYAICQHLKITKFSILAHSAGAIYALATALRMPQHIRGRIHLLAPWIPPSQMNVFSASQAMPPTNAIPTSQRILRALPTPFLKAANSSFMSATSSSITSSLPKSKEARRNKRKSTATAATAAQQNRLDKDNVDGIDLSQSYAPDNIDYMRPTSAGMFSAGQGTAQSAIFDAAADALAEKERQTTYDNRLTYAIWDLATTGANPAVDLLVCLERRHTIGFRYVDITRPVVIHHGSRDTRVPVDNVRWLGKTMRRCEVRVLEGEGHGLMASASVMGNVLMEISKEWEDWMAVTGADRRHNHHHHHNNDRERGRTSRGFGL